MIHIRDVRKRSVISVLITLSATVQFTVAVVTSLVHSCYSLSEVEVGLPSLQPVTIK